MWSRKPFGWRVFLRALESFRDEVRQCSEAYVSLAYYPDYMLAECTTRIPASYFRRLADCGVGLEVTAYPHGSDRIRYGGASCLVVARAGMAMEAAAAGDDGVRLLPSIRRALQARGLTATACVDDDLSFSNPEEFLCTCVPKSATKEPGLLSLNKFWGKFYWPAFLLARFLADQGHHSAFRREWG